MDGGQALNGLKLLDEPVKRRLVIENDDRSYTVADCLHIHSETGVPVLFDIFHHELNNSGETAGKVLESVTKTWKGSDGIPMVDYSNGERGGRSGAHGRKIELRQFKRFLNTTRPFDIDIMLEIKDKEKSALKAVKIALKDSRFSK